MEPMDEEKVIEMCKRGDLSAYRPLYDRYEQPLLRTACRMLGRQEDAEDAVQDAFLRLFRGIDGFRSGARFSTYFFRILINACFDVLRKRKGAEFKDLDIEKMPFHSSCEDKHTLAEAVGALPPKMKSCFTLFAVEEFKHEEIAAILNISEGSVKANIHRARKKLREWLGPAPDGGTR